MSGNKLTGDGTDQEGDKNVFRSLGRLEGIVSAMAKNADDDREYLRVGFGRIHERLDNQSEELSSIRFAVETGAKIDAQVRNELDEVKKEIKPLIGSARMRRAAIGLIISAATVSGITVAVAADAVKSAIRHWLGL